MKLNVAFLKYDLLKNEAILVCEKTKRIPFGEDDLSKVNNEIIKKVERKDKEVLLVEMVNISEAFLTMLKLTKKELEAEIEVVPVHMHIFK